MIQSFADRDTARLFARERVGRFPSELHRVMLRKLVALDAAEALDDLVCPPATDWRGFTATETASTAFVSTINGASAFVGRTEMLTTLRSLTITE